MQTSGYGSLPVTGATITLGGVVLDQSWLLIVGALFLATGVTLLRLTWRRGQGVTSK